jgi:N-acetylglucosamine malate deacetylase 1
LRLRHQHSIFARMIDLLAIMAHPDDAELLCAGALLVTAARGGRAAILDLTAGESGSWGTPSGRAEEAAAAARILGVEERRTAGLPDGALGNTPETRAVVAAHIRRLRPRVVLAHWSDARHPDHRAASELARDASFTAGVRNAPLEGEPWRPHKLAFALTYAENAPKPTFVVDISDVMERKLEAIFAFGSQFENRPAMGDVFGGDRPLRDQIRAYHAYYGSQIRRPYGEPYWTKETMLVEDVTQVGVSSF